MMSESQTAPIASAAPGRIPPRGFFVWLRRQLQFSLATLLEWLLAYAVAFTAMWVRGEQWIVSGVLAGALGIGLVLRIFLRHEGRRVAHYIVFAAVIGLGVAGGLFGMEVLRTYRRAAVEEDSLQSIWSEFGRFQIWKTPNRPQTSAV